MEEDRREKGEGGGGFKVCKCVVLVHACDSVRSN